MTSGNGELINTDHELTNRRVERKPFYIIADFFNRFMQDPKLLIRRGIFRNTIVRGPVAFQLDGPTRDAVDRHFDALQHTLEELS